MLLVVVPTVLCTDLLHTHPCYDHIIFFASLEDRYQVLYLRTRRLYHSLLFPQSLYSAWSMVGIQ